jgi:hypothetical protein
VSATGKMGQKKKAVQAFGMAGLEAPKKQKTVEEETADEMEEFRTAGRTGLDQLQKAEQQYRDAVDTEFWFCVCFQSREQKDAFIRALGWGDLGDKHMDGIELARRLGVEIPDVRIFGALEIKKTLRAMSMQPGKGYKE